MILSYWAEKQGEGSRRRRPEKEAEAAFSVFQRGGEHHSCRVLSLAALGSLVTKVVLLVARPNIETAECRPDTECTKGTKARYTCVGTC